MDGSKKAEEINTINAFIDHFSNILSENIKVTDRPDKKKVADIDAIAQGEKIWFAIEHTSIDSFDKQREDSAGFDKVFGDLGRELRNSFEGFITVSVPVGAVKETRKQSEVKNILRNWLLEKIPTISPGMKEYAVLGLEFKLRINKSESQNKLFGFRRIDPEDVTLSERLNELIERKSRKLEPYKKGCKTILLIESDDGALMEVGLMRKALATILNSETCKSVDEIWFAHSWFEPIEFYRLFPTDV